jgi:hypothetical protein
MGLLAGTLIAAGIAVLFGYGIYRGLYELFEYLPVAVLVGLAMFLAGLGVFIVAVVRARVSAARECGPTEPHTHPEQDEPLR